MAAILKPGGSIASTNAVGTATTSGSTSSSSSQASDVFTQLIAAMIGSAPGSSTPTDPSLDLSALTLEGEPLELTTDDRDADPSDDTEGEDAEIAAMLAALLPVLPSVQPITPQTSQPVVSTATDGIEDALLAKSNADELVHAAIEELTDDSAEPGTAAPPPNDPRSAANATPSMQLHAMLATHTAQDADVVPDGSIRAPVGSPQWKDELGTQLTWMALNNRDAASLKLSPEHLGPLDIRISTRDGEASVFFSAANPETRNALEQSLPRLRELFAAQGMVLTDAGVSRDAPRNAFKPSPNGEGSRSLSDASNEASVTSVTLTRAGLIDTYV